MKASGITELKEIFRKKHHFFGDLGKLSTFAVPKRRDSSVG